MPGMPQPGAEWPSPDWYYAFRQFATNDARYSGDQAALHTAYARMNGAVASRGDNPAYHYNKIPTGAGFRATIARMFRWTFFNGRVSNPDEQRTLFMSPAAYNLANLSADLLAAEPPAFQIVDASGKPVKSPAQDRVDKVLNGKRTNRTLIHAAELTAGLGATVLTAHWNPATSDAPWLDFTPCDAAIPEFIGGQLDAVNLFTVHFTTAPGKVVNDAYVHVERHEQGAIIHALYAVKVTDQRYQDNGFAFAELGRAVPLETVDALAHIPQIAGSVRGDGELANAIILPTGIDQLTASWWRNRPTKTFRKFSNLSMLGRADFEGEGEIILDAIDEVWSSWLRDIKLAKARLIIPESMLDLQSGTPGFDDEREIYQQLAYVPKPDQGVITPQQFAIRATEHQLTLTRLTRELTQFAGYSMSTYGDEATSATATEVVDRTTLTERTRDKKNLYAVEAYDPIARALMELDRVHYRGRGLAPDVELDISIPDLSQIDPEKEARTLQYLRAAMAISTREIVDQLHPDWEQRQKDAEVDRILAENGLQEQITVQDDPGAAGRVGPDGQPLDAGELVQVDASQPGDPGNGNSVTPGRENPPAITQGAAR